jgi:hypothetical protein
LVSLLLMGAIFTITGLEARAQSDKDAAKHLSPRNVLLKSLVLPGWGHLSLGAEHRTRGQWQLGAELALWLGYGGIVWRSGQLEDNLITQASSYAQIDIANRDQDLWIAIGNYASLEEYNRQQLLNRNWNALYDATPANYWMWSTDQARQDFESMRNRWNRTKQQVPAVISALILNRLIAGISAFRRAKMMQEQQQGSSETYSANRRSAALSGGSDEARSPSRMQFYFTVDPSSNTPSSSHHWMQYLRPVVQIRF